MAWRQAAVLQASRKSEKLILAVRVTSEELEKNRIESSFVVSSLGFVLVEGTQTQVRPSCAAPHRALEVEVEALLKKGQEALEAEDLRYITASEDFDQKRPWHLRAARKRTRMAAEEEAGEARISP